MPAGCHLSWGPSLPYTPGYHHHYICIYMCMCHVCMCVHICVRHVCMSTYIIQILHMISYVTNNIINYKPMRNSYNKQNSKAVNTIFEFLWNVFKFLHMSFHEVMTMKAVEPDCDIQQDPTLGRYFCTPRNVTCNFSWKHP